MALKRFFPILLFLILCAISGCGQKTVIIPDGFVETPVPKVSSNEWFQLNYSNNEYGVSVVNDKLEIKKVKEARQRELKILDGTLVGIDNGEWGGQLTFIPDNTTKEKINIKVGNIKFIFSFKDKIYFIEGLAHMGYSGGALYQLDKEGDKFTHTKRIDFEDAPEAFAIYNDKFLIATHQNFYIVQDFKKELIFKDTFWSSLYPNSIAVIDNENVFLGIRGGIVKLDLTNKTMKFYKKA